MLGSALLLAGCGGSSHSQSAANTEAAPTRSVSAVPTSTTSSTSTASSTAGSSGGSATAPTGGAGMSGSSSARVPATFTLAPSGRLDPPTISIPAFLAVAFSVRSASSQPHRVRLLTPMPHALIVPAHGVASVLVPGLRAGSYRVEIDGAGAGTLAIGGEPGP